MTIVMSETRKKQVEDFHVLAWTGYPKAFSRPNGAGHVPLKMGLVDDLRSAFPDIEKCVVEMFLDVYTSSESYQRKCSVPGTPRVGLNGEIRGRVTEGQAAAARRRLAKIATSKDTPAGEQICPKTGKIGYLTGGEALDNARRAMHGESENREASAFRCVHCSRFHWGHKKPWSFVPRAIRAEQGEIAHAC